ncbi:MAG: hypothetical protein DBO99_13175 [gamma proteobacterium symbiont of Ctena orbiculata]|nr:MAG: hypothetical protein DBO99_13175 [gamma proteobacterium symbiont of Ctena orbiculata]
MGRAEPLDLAGDDLGDLLSRRCLDFLHPLLRAWRKLQHTFRAQSAKKTPFDLNLGEVHIQLDHHRSRLVAVAQREVTQLLEGDLLFHLPFVLIGIAHSVSIAQLFGKADCL